MAEWEIQEPNGEFTEQERNPVDYASRPERRWRALVFQSGLLAALLVFAVLAALAQTEAYFPIDLTITGFIQAHRAPWLDALMLAISWPGYGPQVIAVIAALCGLLLILRLRWEAALSFLAAVSALVLNYGLKLAIGRPRPSPDLVEVFRELVGLSFPSGHVMFYTAFFGFLAFLAYALLQPSWKRYLPLLSFSGLVALVGPSRIYLGNHWASDVLGGYLLGGVILSVTIWLYRINPFGQGEKS